MKPSISPDLHFFPILNTKILAPPPPPCPSLLTEDVQLPQISGTINSTSPGENCDKINMFTAAILLPSYSRGAERGRWQPEWGCSWVSNHWVLWGLFSHSSSYQHPCRRTLRACISLHQIHPFPSLGTMEGQIREWKELRTLMNRAPQKCERKRGGKKSRPSWHLKLARGVGHAPSLPCPAWGSTSRSGSPWWCSLACQILLSFQRVEKNTTKQTAWVFSLAWMWEWNFDFWLPSLEMVDPII